jgi:signal recognition particle subunit SRP54
VGGLQNMMQGGNMEAMKRNPQAMMQNMQKNLDPNLLKQMGGMQGVMNMAKGLQGKGGPGGMPDMSSVMKLAQGLT